ncbi:MAG TPA: sigma-70 family RNA polymerase sigma factor [Microvirga sp.]|nr:sigma-70 family RNA polymerase sigma factor [Microvirga sp.]
MRADTKFRDLILAAVPSLRAFAVSLTNDPVRADDLVQDTLMRAWSHANRFANGTNINAWLFTILRNLFHSEYRKRKREVEDIEGSYAQRLRSAPEQQAHVDFQDLQLALARLPPEQREALILVGAEGFSYEEAAQICGCAVGTIKSRVNRARSRLAELLAITDDEIGPDNVTKAAVEST